MKRYTRLTTTQVVNGRNIKPITSKGKVTIQDLIDRLYELEDKIENGTLIEIPCKVGDNAVAIIDTLAYPNAIYNVKLKDLAYIVEDENGDVTFQHITRIFGTKAEAEKRLEEIRNETKSIDSSGK